MKKKTTGFKDGLLGRSNRSGSVGRSGCYSLTIKANTFGEALRAMNAHGFTPIRIQGFNERYSTFIVEGFLDGLLSYHSARIASWLNDDIPVKAGEGFPSGSLLFFQHSR